MAQRLFALLVLLISAACGSVERLSRVTDWCAVVSGLVVVSSAWSSGVLGGSVSGRWH